MSNSSNIKSFLSGFFARKGAYIFGSIIISKAFSFVLTFFVVRMLTTKEYGDVSYAYNIISFIIPFMGFGIYQSLNRFGPIANSQTEKRRLFKYIFRRGVLASFILIALVCLFAGLLTSTLPNAKNILIYFSFLIISLFVLEAFKVLYRVYGLNKLYAYLEIAHTFVLLVLGVVLTYYFQGTGYVISLIASPLIVAAYIALKHQLYTKTEPTKYSSKEKKELWKYGFFTSLVGLSSKLLFSVDLLMIGFLLKNETDVALYKVASIIPFSLLFIPGGFIKTDIIKITQEYQNKSFLMQYIKNYILLFSAISIIIALLLWLLSPQIIALFGSNYQLAEPLLPIFGLGIIGAFVFRNLFGNIIDAIGWAKTSSMIAIAILLLDVIGNYYMVMHYGIIGAAITTSVLLWLSGIAAAIAIALHIKSLD